MGGGSCSVFGCKSRTSNSGKHFYKFPKANPYRELWITFTRRGSDYEPKKYNCICQDHFHPSCFRVKEKQIRLEKNSVPTIFYRNTSSDDTRVELTFDVHVLHYLERESLLSPIYDRDKHEAELLKKRDQRLKEVKDLCRFCCDDSSQVKFVAIAKLKDYGIRPTEVFTLVGIDSQHNGAFSDAICEECFQQIVTFDGFRRRCCKAQERMVEELTEPDEKLRKVRGTASASLSWTRMETTWDELADEARSEESSSLAKIPEESHVHESTFQSVSVKPESENDITSDDDDFGEPTVDDEAKTQIPSIFYKPDRTSGSISNVEQQLFAHNSYECFFCRLKFAGRKTFRAHRCQVKEVKCPAGDCEKTFKAMSGFNSHITRLHKLSKLSRLFCIICKLSMIATDEDYKRHSRSCEKKSEKEVSKHPVVCELCDKSFPSIQGLRVHMMYHNSKSRQLSGAAYSSAKYSRKKLDRGVFICETCGKEFECARYLTHHIKRIHRVEENPTIYTCDMCGKTRTNRALLSKHIRNVHVSSPTPCKVCGKVFKNRPMLLAHMIYHKDSKFIHFCPLCPDHPPWCTAVALKRHQESNHGAGPGHPCDICSAVYKTRKALIQHTNGVHGVQAVRR